MKKRTINPLLLLFLMLFTSLGSALAAPGDFLFDIGTPHLFGRPSGIAVDANSNLYAINLQSVLLKVNSAGKFVTQWGSIGTDNGQFKSPEGLAVDSYGNVYVADTGNNRIQKFDASGTYLGQWGSSGGGNGQFARPVGLAIDSSGNVYVADADNFRVQMFNSSGGYLAQWGSFGSGNGQFEGISAIAVDCTGSVYVTESTNRIQKFTSTGSFLLQWGSAGTGNGQFSGSLQGIAADCSGNVYVSDTNAHRIEKFDAYGNYLAQWGSIGNGNGQLQFPADLALDASGNLYVDDNFNDRVQKFSPSGSYLAQFGSNDIGQFRGASGIAADPSGNVFVTDNSNGSIQKFDAGGAFLTRWQSPNGSPQAAAADNCGNVYAIDGSSIVKFTDAGQPLTQWGVPLFPSGVPMLPIFNPDAVAVDSACNNVYVIDHHGSVVVNFSSTGAFVKLWDRFDLQFPDGIAVDRAGNVYVANTFHDNIVKFDSSGNVITRWGTTGTGEGQFQHPYGVAVDASGNVYVADTDNHRIQVFSDTGTFKGQWGTSGNAAGQFNLILDLATNRAGTLVYVTDGEKVHAFTGFGSSDFTLSYLAGPNGSISGGKSQNVPSGGSGTQVTAVPNSGYRFISWSDGVTTASRADSNVNANLSVTANFSLIQSTYTLTFTAGAGGTVCGTSPQILWPGGWSSVMTAVPNTGYHFVNWTGDNGFITSTENPLQLKYVQAAYNVTANFALDAPPSSYTLTFKAGAGGTISGPTPQIVSPGVSSAPVCAVANGGYHFVNWTGTNGFVTTTANPLILTNVQASRTIIANFAADTPPSTYTLTFKAGTGGSISGTSPQILWPGGWSSPVNAAAKSGYHFANWTGDNGFVATTVNPLQLRDVAASYNITANFAPDQNPSTYTLTFKAGPGGTIRGTSPQILWPGGWSSAVTAVPKSGYHFVNWTGDHGFVTTTANPVLIKGATASQNLTANFAPN